MAQGTMLGKLMFPVLITLMLSGFITMAQQSPCNGFIVMNLTLTSQVWCVPHVYQGEHNGQPVNTYPVYYGPSTAYQNYWSFAKISSNQPVLELVPAQVNSTGVVFWSGYYEGGSVTITLVGTYTAGTLGAVADGFEIYLFIKPSGWSTTNPASNYSIPFVTSYTMQIHSIQVGGLYIFPYVMLNTKYIIIQWDPYWSYGNLRGPPNGGDWNVLIGVSNGSSVPPTLNVIGVGGIGSGAFEPHPGDLIDIKVTYDPSTNMISGVAHDLNTGQLASFSYSLNGYFTPPSPGYYTFGIAASTGGLCANWGIIVISEKGITYTTTTNTTTLTTIPTITVTTTVALTTTSIVTVTSPVTTTVTSTVTTASPTTVTSTVTTAVIPLINPSLISSTILSITIFMAAIIALIIVKILRSPPEPR